jgi:dienelactone hydrolase
VCYGIETPWKTSVPPLTFLEGLDDMSPAWACQDLAKRLPPFEIRLYPAARHAFDVPDLPSMLRRERGGTLGHDPQAAAAAREEVRRFLAR